MKNPAPYIRKAFFSLLNGTVGVPVFEGEGDASLHEQIIIADQSWTDRSTKHSFTGTFSQLIEIVTEVPGKKASRNRVDEIGETVMQLVQPTPRTIGLAETEFQIIGLNKENQSYLIEESGSGSKIVRLLIRYGFIVNQINL